MKKIIFKLLCFGFILSSIYSYAHEPNQSYIFLSIYETKGIEGHYEINVKELNKIFNFNMPKDASIEDFRPYGDLIKDYFFKNTAFKSELDKYTIVFGDYNVISIGKDKYFQYYFKLSEVKELPDDLHVYYNIGFEEDPQHKGFLTVEYNWKAGLINNESIIALDFSPSDPNDTLKLSESSIFTGFIAMVKQGIWHIWIGLDHILFLLALILPAVVRRKNKSLYAWEPVKTFKVAFLYIIKVVTFFTIAHTITLTLASLNIVNLPSQIVESIIAFSIGLAAFHNIRPIFKMKDWIIAFIFGLFHGFGFASVLSDLGLTGEFLTLSLLGFNIGVEIGQLVIIACIFPVLYLIRKYKFYPKFLVYLSALLIIVSMYWVIERVLDINLYIDDYIFQWTYKTAKWLGLK